MDERQSQSMGKYAMVSFAVMYILSAIAIVVQLYMGNGEISSILGETIIMLAGGIVYLYGTIKTGTFSANGICKGKGSIFVNVSISIFISAIFTVAYGIIIHKLAGDKVIQTGRLVAMFFVGIFCLCFVVLVLIGALSNRENKKAEMKYDDDNEVEEEMPKTKKSMNPVKVYMASNSMEADMLVEILSKNGISAYKQSIDGGIMDVYSGNSNKGDYIFVDSQKIEEAKQFIEEYKLS